MRVMVQAKFTLFGIVKREGDWFIAHCPPLDLASQGRTLTEAKKNLIEASQLFIISCLERGTLEQAMRELGFVPLNAKPQNVPNAFPIAIPVPFGFEKSLLCRA
jgi:predicted RNase H-like HicB family nuclease